MAFQTPADHLDGLEGHPEEVIETALTIALDSEWRSGGAPAGWAAAALYAAYRLERPMSEAGDGRLTQDEAAEVFGVSTPTVRARLTDLQDTIEARRAD